MSRRLSVPSRLTLTVPFHPSPKAVIARAMVLALVVAGFTVVGGGQALASHVGCGDTITTDTTLDSDLVNCPNNGIIIGADNITLDLNGHTIDGDGTPVDPCPEGELCDIGVLNLAGHDRLTIVGGTVQQFGVGVLVEGGAAHRLHQFAASDNTDFGIIVGGSTDSVIEQTSMSDNGTSGLVLVESRGALVAGNAVSGSNGYAIFTAVVDDSRIQNNDLDGNDHGIAVFDGGSRNLIQQNVVSHSSGSAIDVGGGAGNRIERNRLIDNGDGIITVDVQDTLISRNLLTDTGSSTTPEQSGGFGILVDGGDRTTVDRNILTGGRGPAIFVSVLEAPTVPEDTRRLTQRRNRQPDRRDPGRQRCDRDPAGPQHRQPQRRRRHRRRRPCHDPDPQHRQSQSRPGHRGGPGRHRRWRQPRRRQRQSRPMHEHRL